MKGLHLHARHDQGPVYEAVPQRASSPAEPEKRPEKSFSQSWMALALNTWFWEGVAMVFSLLCFIAIVCILGAFNGKTRPDFAYGFTLNAIVSILATASKSSLTYMIGECIGQLKWIWFYKKERQLDHIQLFDSASRGPLGALYVIFQHKGRSIVSLGALVVVLVLTFDPFVQQILTYPTREVVDPSGSGRAVAKQAKTFIPDAFDTDMQTIINTGIWSQFSSYLQPNVTCSSGNCKWPPFQSVGLCSQCEDITPQTTFNCTPSGFNDTSKSAVIPCQIVPPQGDPISIRVGLESTTDPSNPDSPALLNLNLTEHNVWPVFNYDGYSTPSGEIYAGIPDPQFVIAQAELRIVSNQTTTPSPLADLAQLFHIIHATQCAVGICARTYNVSVTNGTASFDVSPPDFGQRFANPDAGPVPIDMAASWPTCWKPSQGTAGNDTGVTEVYGGSAWANVDEFASCKTGDFSTLSKHLAGTTELEQSITQYGPGDFSRWSKADTPDSDTPAASVARILSKGLEPVIRDVAASFTKAALSASNFTAGNGTVLVSEVYVSVDWAWLALPAALVVMGIVFLVLTAVLNRRQRLFVWKSSILAVLFHGLVGLEGEGNTGFSGLKTDTAVDMDTTAQSIHAKLKQGSTSTEETDQSQFTWRI
ncbi:hypothetical protein ASPVEDRAFT_87499 [Aspergillus versicolor CBS 583.65]|uniref:Uncharacterized protein n=1 Tax=Aspergillus versicolor CBS 583.65 TaxID=1036611 RepID=A0A1L9PXN8_ASPVE|nr:uncharacterized protein ASPVEDRAFT_87499 [Aspergillus versicolor CBS 583.65]OJJ06186.1 hypothetical protein ASPVEDRAFT_87499 [Aspergillus versicolor CBS 583.65]